MKSILVMKVGILGMVGICLAVLLRAGNCGSVTLDPRPMNTENNSVPLPPTPKSEELRKRVITEAMEKWSLTDNEIIKCIGTHWQDNDGQYCSLVRTVYRLPKKGSYSNLDWFSTSTLLSVEQWKALPKTVRYLYYPPKGAEFVGRKFTDDRHYVKIMTEMPVGDDETARRLASPTSSIHRVITPTEIVLALNARRAFTSEEEQISPGREESKRS